MRIHHRLTRCAILSAGLSLALTGCSDKGLPNGPTASSGATAALALGTTASETRIVLPFDATNFAEGVPNRFFPIVPGTIATFTQDTPDGRETNTVEVTHQTKTILGVKTTVVHDRVYLEGKLKEDTFDWYASDKDGNVWYFGEDTKEIAADGSVSTQGSWEAGKGGAAAGIIMLANPQVGDTYYQENAPGVVADQARVKSLDETATVPFGTFTGCVKTQEWTPLEPGNRAFKVYAPGFGTVLEVPNQGGGVVELTAVTGP